MKKYNISPLFLLVLLSFVLIDGSFFSVFAVISALCHEAGHILTAKLLNLDNARIYSKMYGISLKTKALSYRDEIKIALAGPLVSFCLFIIFSILFDIFRENKYLLYAAFSNFALFTLNILPLYPLDGGRALYCFLCLKINADKVRIIIKTVSFLFLLPLGILSVIIFLRSGFNLSLLIICLLLVTVLTGDIEI